MKKIMAAVLALFLCCASMAGCGTDRQINGKWYETKGLVTKSERNPCIRYKVIAGNVVWGIILVETIIAPIYFFGFSLWEPVEPSGKCKPKAEKP